ncbi:hypothetical protein, partial [Pseudomonas juntendi]|uniref:hypothetical protein n=1 Tax=Pseudomonas juntendi TaxID=2666183 RepID=UPI001E2955D1
QYCDNHLAASMPSLRLQHPQIMHRSLSILDRPFPIRHGCIKVAWCAYNSSPSDRALARQ